MSNLIKVSNETKQKMDEMRWKVLELATEELKKAKLTKRQKRIAHLIVKDLQLSPDTLENLTGISIAKAEKRILNRGTPAVVNSFYDIKKLMKQNGPKHDKTRFFGIEIECIVPADVDNSYCEYCDGDGCEDCPNPDNYDTDGDYERIKEAFKSAKLHDIQVKSDGSIDYDSSCEIPVEVTFTCSINNLEKIDRVCAVLNKLDAKVDDSCGLHVHIDMRNLTKSVMMEETHRLINALPVLTRLVPKSRRSNTYCQNNKGKISQNDRYYMINYTAYSKFKTIECRLHSGTTNAKKIKNWCILLHKISKSDSFDDLNYEKIEEMISDDFFCEIGLDYDLRRFFLKREALFLDEKIECEQKNNENVETTIDDVA